MQQLITPNPIVTRPAFVEANPVRKDAHRAAQKAMFKAANMAGLSTRDEARDEMLDGINDALGLRGSKRLISRRQMTVEEMQIVAVAIDAGLFSPDWTWGNEFTAQITTISKTVVHFEPRNSNRRAFIAPLHDSAEMWDTDFDGEGDA